MKRINNSLLVLLFLIASGCINSLGAQCATDNYSEQVLAKHPEIRLFEDKLNKQAQTNTLENRASIYTIPVVFHVIHTNGLENISREQILDQLRVLNNDFSLLNGNRNKLRSVFSGLAADCQINFSLAKIDPNGNCTDGIKRIYSPLGNEMDMTKEEVKNLSYWNYKKYLNIWVIGSIASETSGSTILGYAVFPWMSGVTNDGIVLRSDRVGTIGTAASENDSGRVLTHEVGHWLGLYHTFQDGCANGDLIDDTPPVKSAFTNSNCPSNGNSCSTDVPNLPDLWEDYMDYSKGSCQTLFTKNQKTRMHFFLTSPFSPRVSLSSASNLVATGITVSSVTPLAEFSSNTQTICTGQPIYFYDLSCKGKPTAWSWTFNGASQPSSSLQNPVVSYQTAGIYPVSLTVENGKGSNTVSKTNYITVINAVADNKANYEQGFEEGDPTSFIGNNKFIHSSPVSSRFEMASNASFTGSNSFKAPIITNQGLGKCYSFTLPSFDISNLGASTPRFTFYVSYAQPNADLAEELRVFVSTDCGATFKQILSRLGASLAYPNQVFVNNFVPTKSSQWRLMGISSLSSIGLGLNSNLTFRIDVVSAGGNPVYLDNINVGMFFAGLNSIGSQTMRMDISPNPVEKNSKISVMSMKPNEFVRIELLDLQGRKVANIFSGILINPTTTIFLSDLDLPASGLYSVRMYSESGHIQKPIILGK
ncbi:MAG: PKD domain-containing protein [Flavobacteriaceae bacterium]|nr:PKD domain-containing protein [Flavobacteriaceae bacterium]